MEPRGRERRPDVGGGAGPPQTQIFPQDVAALPARFGAVVKHDLALEVIGAVVISCAEDRSISAPDWNQGRTRQPVRFQSLRRHLGESPQ